MDQVKKRKRISYEKVYNYILVELKKDPGVPKLAQFKQKQKNKEEAQKKKVDLLLKEKGTNYH